MKFDVTTMVTNMPATIKLLEPAAQVTLDDDADSAMPAELRSWLVRLRLLEGVPFANLVADTELLPEESIRWFYLDRRWTDALVQGALSVGTVNTDDRTLLTAAYPAIRDELDREERNVRRQPGSPRFGGSVDAISGFILRSQAVSGWPGLHVRALRVDPHDDHIIIKEDDDPQQQRLRLLRLERLAPAVLFCLFDGIPKVVHIEEPRQGIQFGFDLDPHAPDGQHIAKLTPRRKADFTDIPNADITVPFRSGTGSSGVVDIQQLERQLAKLPATGAADGLDSAEYALQLVRFPYRQAWGEVDAMQISAAFRATVQYAELRTSFLEEA